MPVLIPIKLLVLLDRNSSGERTSMYCYFGIIRRHSASIVSGRNVATVGEFGIYIL